MDRAKLAGELLAIAKSLVAEDKTSVSLYHAAYLLFDKGMKPDKVEGIMKKLKQPTKGYVYMEDLKAYL